MTETPAAPLPAAPAPAAGGYPGGRGPAPMTPSDETTWSTLGHLSWLAGSVVGLPFLGPLVLWLVLKDRGPFVRHHTAEALNFQVTVMLWLLGVGVVGGVATLVTFGVLAPALVLALVAVLVLAVVLTVVAAVAASRGEWYRYPLTLRLAR
ncbi:DUF4870 domain-containing protein [Aquipuribacter nitratireducens]|uniref:DUF4870 domain-containing protein n=1 Tax=Aquipuribacter nitratireducens TaxID=650104 RepID=A0ABW0GKM9_9MICO